MLGVRHTAKIGACAALLLSALTLSSCGYAKRDQVNTDMDRLREEMRAGDQQVAESMGRRIDDVAGRLEDRIAALERDLNALQQDFRVTVERLEASIRFNVPVHFAFDDATLAEENRPVLDRFSNVVAQYYPTALITVEGFADPAGSAAYNRALGERRAQAVMTYLTDVGNLDEGQVRIVSYGEEPSRQVVQGAHGPGDTGWENRRVTLVIDHGSTEPPPGVTGQIPPSP